MPDGASTTSPRSTSPIIEATSDLVCAYKPNVAFYEALGPERGYAALRETLAADPAARHHARRRQARRCRAHGARLRARRSSTTSASTRHRQPVPRRRLRGAVDRARRTRRAFIVCRTSNPGAPDLQDLQVQTDGGARPLYEIVARARASRGTAHGNVGLVVGATYPGRDARACASSAPTCRSSCRASARSRARSRTPSAPASMRAARGLLVSASRGVTYASKGADFAAGGAARGAPPARRDQRASAQPSTAARNEADAMAEIIDFRMDDVVRLRKPHPCGGFEWAGRAPRRGHRPQVPRPAATACCSTGARSRSG